MTRVLRADVDSSLHEASRVLEDGGVVIVPTDTVYGLAALPDRAEAIRQVFAAKQRPRELALPILVSGLDQAAGVAVFDAVAKKIGQTFWPGPLTIVLPRAKGFSADLGQDRHTVGVRWPNHAVLLRLLEMCGPLAVTSANFSGEPTPTTIGDLAEVFREGVDLFLDGGPSGTSVPSTVLSMIGDRPKLLRLGVIAREQIAEIAGELED